MNEIKGKCIGSCVINDYLILFTNDIATDRIYKIKPPNDIGVSDIIKLFDGSLNFSQNNLIQTLPFYENENVQKVYWIDGLNQPRVINVAIDDARIYLYQNTSFDFIQSLELSEIANVQKLYTGGYFKSGVIQYAATYFNKNGAESNIFWISDINYISLDDRAGKPDEIVQNSFKIAISNLEDKYGYVRLYSIYRTALDATPEVKIVTDLKIPSSKLIVYTDAGTSGSIVSSDILLYVGGEELVPQCMSQKNNTLFLGNISLPNNDALPATLKSTPDVPAIGVPAHASTFEWTTKTTILEDLNTNSSMYPYKPFVSNIKHFKFDETYRFGIQGQFSNGKWSTPIWLGEDYKVPNRYSTKYTNNNTQIQLDYVNAKYNIASELREWFISVGFKKVRPVMVPLSYSDRTIIAQGLVNNTIGDLKNRSLSLNSTPFSYPDYIFRNGGVRKNSNSVTPTSKKYTGRYAHLDLIPPITPAYSDTQPNRYAEVMGNWKYPTYTTVEQFTSGVDEDAFFIDRNMVNFWSPDLINNYEQLNVYIKNSTSVGLYGFSFQAGFSNNLDIDYGNIDRDDYSYSSSYYPNVINNYYTGSDDFDSKKSKSLWPLIKATPTGSSTKEHKTYHMITAWSPENYIIELPYRGNSEYDGETVDINFTIFNKSSFNYYGVNRTLKNTYASYMYDINNPYPIVNDSNIYYESNAVDNTGNNGNIIYSKNVNKIYPSNSYFNTFKYEKDASTGRGGINLSRGFFGNNWPVKSGMSVKYNTATHAIFSFKERVIDGSSKYACMPRLQNFGELSSYRYEDFLSPQFYRQTGNGFRTEVINRNNLNDIIDSNDYTTINSIPIFDLYKTVYDSVRYGGKTSQALYNNTWIPCGNAIAVTSGSMILEYSVGDTYIGRFDLLRVFPNDINQIVQHTEIVSFICESFVNPDGRSDVNRYNTDSSLMTTGNYGLFNNVYSQKDNYFSYRILDPDLFNTDDYSNTIVWSKTKLAGEKVDTWTNINMLSSIDLDGVYGDISSINLFNSELYAFQPNGIARLLFNERIQQQASDGISVELANGYKVPEYRYLTNQYGSSNKWSIVEGKNGIYFIDYKNRSFNLLGEGVKDLSLQNGFKSWFNENVVNKNYTLSYDKINNDIYIHDDLNCLGYSESLNSFVSFYDYVKTIQMKNVWDKFISMKNNPDIFTESLQNSSGFLIESENELYEYISEASYNNSTSVWIHNSGEYNKFYDELKPFSIEYLFNPEPQYDKVFNTFEYRMDNQLIDWTDLSLNNWYQTAQCNSAQYKSRMKRKFNVNRVQLPRQNDTHNRIRSTWMKMKLQHTPTTVNNNNKFEMQDLNLTYTI